jgi:hypothetical protein
LQALRDSELAGHIEAEAAAEIAPSSRFKGFTILP